MFGATIRKLVDKSDPATRFLWKWAQTISHGHDPGLAGARGHLESIAAKVLRRQVLNAVGVEFRHIAEDLPAAVHCRLELDRLPHPPFL